MQQPGPRAALPRLGDPFASFSSAFGPPLYRQDSAFGMLASFAVRGLVITVLVAEQQGQAVFLPYGRRLATLLHQFRWGGPPVHILAADHGLVVALERCPSAAIRLLAAAAKPRPMFMP